MRYIKLRLFIVLQLIMFSSYAVAQSCSIYFTSPKNNKVFRTPRVSITGSGTGHAQPTDVGSAMATLNGGIFFSQTGRFTALLQFLGSGAASIVLREGRNDLTVQGSVNSCHASDNMQLFYVPPLDKCYSMVESLNSIHLLSTDPTRGFVVNQTCIAKYSCANRKQMQDPDWLTKVVPAFVDPYIKQSGKWNEVLARCKEQETLPKFIRESRCQRWMANYHIEQDLQSALNTHGCGTVKDWDAVGDYIKQCVTEENNKASAWIINKIVNTNRNEVRQKCTYGIQK